MTAIWMLYVSAFGLCVGLAALAAERAAALWVRPRRFVWTVAIVASLLLPSAALVLPGIPVPRGVAPGSLLVETVVFGPGPAPASPTSGPVAHRKLGALVTALDRPLLLLWGLASLALALGLLRASLGLRRRARRWRTAVVDGTEVLVAADLGPAVVRLGGLKVVLPEWALSAEPAERSLMLRHENEHRAARDPDLLLGATVAVVLAPWALPLWWQWRRLRLAVETDCDRRVMRAGADAHAYGVLLLSVGARLARQPLLAPTAFSEARTLLEGRIEAMTSAIPKRRLARTALAAGLGALGVAAACMVPHPAPAAAQQAERVYPEDSVEERPEMLTHPPLKYPDSLRAAGTGGHVEIEAVIDTSGRAEPASVRVLASTNALFETTSREVALGATYRPGTLHGKAVAVRIRIPFNFQVATKGPEIRRPPGVYSPDSVTERPRLLDQPALRIPDSLRAAGITYGAVVAVAVVDSTGHVDPATLQFPYVSNPGFEAPAREALAASAYAPGRLDGRAVPVMIVIMLKFRAPTDSVPRR